MKRSLRYAELRCRTNFSFLTGASHPDELLARAAELGYAALAVTDVNSLAGVVRAHVAAKAKGVKLLIGAEITPADAPAVLLYAPDLQAYGRLSRLITRGRRSAVKGECQLRFADVAEHAEGLLAVVVPGSPSVEDPLHPLLRYREVFRDRCHLAVSLHRGAEDDQELDRFVALARRARLSLVATNDVHYHDPARRMLHDVLTAIRHGVPVAELGERRFPNGERYLKSPAEMTELFRRYPRALADGLELAARCRFSLDELRYEYPEEVCPADQTPTQHLAHLTWEGAKERYPAGVPPKVATLLGRELQLIEQLRYEAYFLTVWDLVKFARARDILCQGRGSAANSAVCYCLGITSVDPDRTDVLFERFISQERNEPPDIDVDFEHERREEVLQYVYQKYGRDRAGITAEVITYRPRSAVRDVGKALGLSLDCVDRLAKLLDHYGDEANLPVRLKEAGLDPASPGAQHLMVLATELLGFPRHLSQHVGGFVITRGPLSEVVPIENAAMPGRTVIQWDKEDLDALGILKVDCLSLGMLTAIHKCFDLVEKHVIHDPVEAVQSGFVEPPLGGLADNGLSKERVSLYEAPVLSGHEPGLSCRLQPAPGLPPASAGGKDLPSPTSRLQPGLPEARPQARLKPAGREFARTHRLKPVADREPAEAGMGKVLPAASGTISKDGTTNPNRIPFIPFSPEARARGERHPLTLATIPAEDPVVYEMICRADTVGVFQIESRAQMAMLPRLRPRCFYDLVIEVAIVRPGPIQGGMVHPYLRRRNGEEPVTYANDAVRRVLAKTLGVPLFQEQVMRLAMEAAGFSAGEADQLRRAMGAWRRPGLLDQFGNKLRDGMLARGLPASFAAQIFAQIRGFGEYGFPESHAASFALLAYVSAWLKCHYPAAFAAALLNSQPMGFYAPAQLVRDARDHGVEVRPVDVNHSAWDCTLEGPALRLGFRLVKGLPLARAEAVVAARQEQCFRSVADFVRRSGVGRALATRLAVADAFRSLGLGRRAALWHALCGWQELPLFAGLEEDGITPPLGEMPLNEEVITDYDSVGLSLKAHPIELVRADLELLQVVPASVLARARNQAPIRVAGLVLVRQRPATAKGTLFMTLEDETATANLVVWPAVWRRYRHTSGAVAVLAQGRVERSGRVVHVVVNHLEDLSQALAGLASKSRDFR